MAYNVSTRMLCEEVRTLAHGSILAAGTYMGIGDAAAYPARMILFQNHTDADLMFSLDGIVGNFPLKAGVTFILDVSSNKSQDGGFYLAKGERVYVTQIDAPSSGSVYVTYFYGKD